MYRVAKGEMVKQGLTLSDVAEVMDITPSTLSLKLNEKYPMTFNEAKQFKEIVKSDLPLETLFESSEETE